MNLINIFRRKAPRDNITFELRKTEAKLVLQELLSSGADMDGIIVIQSINREPRVMAGGIDNEYEALGLLEHAKHEISNQGLPLL